MLRSKFRTTVVINNLVNWILREVDFNDPRVPHVVFDAVCEQHMECYNCLRLKGWKFRGVTYLLYFFLLPKYIFSPFFILFWIDLFGPSFVSMLLTLFLTENQGSLIIFNLNPSVSPLALKEIFQVFGVVKESRDAPMKKNQSNICGVIWCLRCYKASWLSPLGMG